MNQNILNEFSIKETIGQGSFSKVKLGINKLTGEKVAIKIMDKKRIKLLSEKKRVQRELNIIKKLNHINIAKIYQIKEDTNNIYIIMEYIENNLFYCIMTNKYLSEQESSFYFFQLISGLDYIHSLGIVHRDLKPENILLTKKRLLKIIDFGLSNYYIKGKLLSTSCGSPSYTAPEVILGKKYDGCKIDIWTCGIILYVMVCGYLPFEEKEDKNSLFKKIIKGRIEYPRYISDIAKNLLEKILVTDPDKRINLEDIKKHKFYLKGKNIFYQKFPEFVNKIEINKCNENDVKIKKSGPNFNLLKKILRGTKYNKEEKENKKNDSINKSKNKNIPNIELLHRLTKEKEIFDNKYNLTEKNKKNIFNEEKNSFTYKFDKEKNRRNIKTSRLDNDCIKIRTTSYINNSSKNNTVSNDCIYNNSEILNNKKKLLTKKEKYNNSFSNRKTRNIFYLHEKNKYKNKSHSTRKNSYMKKDNKIKIKNIYNTLLNNIPDEKCKEIYLKCMAFAKEKKKNKNMNKSENKRNTKKNNISINNKNNSVKNIKENSDKNSKKFHKRKNKKNEDKYNIKEIIKRRGLDNIIK